VARPHAHSVLVVDDDRGCREGLVAFLGAIGFSVRSARNAIAALAMLEGGLRPCLAIIDAKMATWDGWEFAERLRRDARFADLPLVMLASDGGATYASRAIRLGARAYVTKPADLDYIRYLVGEHCPVQGPRPGRP
jgi:chemosensory pili system protein ChpA (sensor histidine kinase/response regulator)